MSAPDLRYHGDAELSDGLIDLAVNVRPDGPPAWLFDLIASSLGEIASYPKPDRARAAVAERHRRDAADVLLTAGAAEAFVLVTRALRPQRAVVVHPQFTEPEAALRAAGHRVDRVILDPVSDFALDPALVPDDADLVVLGNPTNPTSVLHPPETVLTLVRPGRVLVVDEAFMACVPGETASLAARGDLRGVVVVRSLTKTWGIAGLRIGYVLAEPSLVARLAAVQPLWPVSVPALAAAEACSSPRAAIDAERAAVALSADRGALVRGLAELDRVRVVEEPQASFVLIELADAMRVRNRLRAAGFAVRRCDTFPGLGNDWLRLAVRDQATTATFLDALAGVLASAPRLGV